MIKHSPLILALIFVFATLACGPATPESNTPQDQKETEGAADPKEESEAEKKEDKGEPAGEDCDTEDEAADPFDLGQCPEPKDGYDPLLDEPIEEDEAVVEP